ncbi:MAG: hypothetical protein OEY27_08325, partial [Gammaproteobacteria bacterium]|nr:hypothetical protein [Gammaproteobacteria bacterium]
MSRKSEKKGKPVKAPEKDAPGNTAPAPTPDIDPASEARAAAEPGKKYILRATGLQKIFDEGSFNVHVLKGVYLRIAPGERVAIVGASG